jgi:capsular exopolysaccharide synthesis family protein
VLIGDVPLADAVRSTSVANLSLLSAGHVPPNPAELLGSPRYLALFEELKRRYEWIVFDAPPVMPVTDAAIIARSAGGVLFVIGTEMTPRQSALTALEHLRAAGATFVGAVLNRVNLRRHAYYYAPYYRKDYAKYYQRSAHRA